MVETVRSELFTVRSYEADANGALSLHALCDYLQETAGHHAKAFGVSIEDLLAKNLTWVLSRLRVRVSRYPVSGEKVKVRTWPSGIDRLFALRDFQVFDADGCPIAAASSAWLIIDAATRKPVRIQGVFDVPDTSGIPRALSGLREKLPGLEEGYADASGAHRDAFKESRFAVRFSDIDVNRHANNTSYIQWVVESAGPEALDRSRVRWLAIDYLAETRYGSTVIARTRAVGKQEEAGTASAMAGDAAFDGDEWLRHALFRQEDSREIARAQTAWTTASKGGPA